MRMVAEPGAEVLSSQVCLLVLIVRVWLETLVDFLHQMDETIVGICDTEVDVVRSTPCCVDYDSCDCCQQALGASNEHCSVMRQSSVSTITCFVSSRDMDIDVLSLTECPAEEGCLKFGTANEPEARKSF